jgi:hypothetical protein
MNFPRFHSEPDVPDEIDFPDDPAQAADLPYDLAQQALSRNLDSIDALDAKIGNIFTWAGGLIALLAAVFAIRTGTFHSWGLAIFIVAAAIYAVIAALTLGTLWSKNWRSGPLARDVIDDYHRGTSEATARWTATYYVIVSKEANDRKARRKINALRACFLLLAAETVAVVAGLCWVAH